MSFLLKYFKTNISQDPIWENMSGELLGLWASDT